jgi:hypothetical protein
MLITMDILAATHSYETWLEGFTPLDQPDLKFKHKQMASAADPFPFFRATYYRWVQRWAKAAGELVEAPVVLSVGDLHVENFGTWRDADGRLCWGVNDFDEADHLPYTNDLVRLAASVLFAKRAGALNLRFAAACKAILAGYRDCWKAGGTPFVLEEHNAHLRALAMAKDRNPRPFWKKLTALLQHEPADPPAAARTALLSALPVDGVPAQFRHRRRVGMGSLGKPRYVALAQCTGGWMAREAKVASAPATAWAEKSDRIEPCAAKVVGHAIRSPDPFYRLVPGWVLRRLGPRCSRLELVHLKQATDKQRILRAMGSETANVHAGTPHIGQAVQIDLARRPKGWLEDAARTLARLLERDWRAWRHARVRSASPAS